jgi:hypothetical protein
MDIRHENVHAPSATTTHNKREMRDARSMEGETLTRRHRRRVCYVRPVTRIWEHVGNERILLCAKRPLFQFP